MSKLSDNIKKRRWELNMTQDELAKKIGYKGRASINKIENGESDVPTSKIESFAEALDVSVAWLMGLESPNIEIGEEGYLEVLAGKLRENEFKAEFFLTSEEAVDYILKRCTYKTVGLGSSSTLVQMGLIKKLEEADCEIFYASETRSNFDSERKAITANVFILTANGISYETGEMVNMSHKTSRIAGSLFGPDEIIFVIGKNKITPNLSDAINKVRNVTMPKICKERSYRTPCVESGMCEDCHSTDRACRVMCVYYRKPELVNMTVILIDENLGS